MSNLEHYFENLLFYGYDISGDLNRNELSKEQREAVEECADYVIYSLFGNRELFKRFVMGDSDEIRLLYKRMDAVCQSESG